MLIIAGLVAASGIAVLCALAMGQAAARADALQEASERKVQPVEPRVIVEGGVAQVLLPGEPGYAI